VRLKRLSLAGFKSFAKRTEFIFDEPISAIVGPNGSGKSNVVEAIRFVLGEQSNKSMRSKQASDLIFKGSDQVKQANRAEVSVTFDNKDGAFVLHQEDNSSVSLSFDEITLRRVVHQDGAGEYFINDSPVRLRDIHELIASVNIGSSGHHIISQGEADRVLSASARERREMIEDALGLKVYQFRLREAERKLEKSSQNIREVELQRKELAPHLRYLKREVERIERAKQLRVEIEADYRVYLAAENAAIEAVKATLRDERIQLVEKGEVVQQRKKELKAVVDSHTSPELRGKVEKLKQQLQVVDAGLHDANRKVGLLEGKLSGVRDTLASLADDGEVQVVEQPVALREVLQITDELIAQLNTLENESSLAALHAGMTALKTKVQDFRNSCQGDQKKPKRELGMFVKLESQISVLETELEQARASYGNLEQEKKQQEHSYSVALQELRAVERDRNEAEKELFSLQAEARSLSASLEFLEQKKNQHADRLSRFTAELEEGRVLIGQAIHEFDSNLPEEEMLSESEIKDLYRSLERKKLKLEDMGAGGGREILDAYEEAKDRDEFLAREIHDLETTIEKLIELQKELEETIQTSFASGIEAISKAFHDFFTAMFGGGRAHLETIMVTKRKRKDDEEGAQEEETGVVIQVKLPNKKVTEIDMLSGGERSLTSIALLFALSQVNPPPFLVLDETDAALDEANSRRYGDMLERLSSVAQLVVVTHNRETMSRAQNLYGVTMKDGGASQMLSIKLEEALETAK